MTDHKVISKEQWREQRNELLLKEKELTRRKDELAKELRELAWVRVENDYVFEGVNGPVTLSALFDGSSQLIVYHFMFQPDWNEGCKSCSLIADHYNPLTVHLRHRDANLVAISRASIEKLEAFRKRMGWSTTCVSSLNCNFNADFDVYFPDSAVTEGPAASVFFKDEDGLIYHTYSCKARGLERFMSIYEYLDVLPKGRNEDGLVYPMEWVRHHDKYGDESFKDIYVELILSGKLNNE